MDVSLEEGFGDEHFTLCQFQSLFSWMFRSKILAAGFRPAVNMFQSLFSWMFRSKRIRKGATRRDIEFQSLFSWMFRSKNPDSVVYVSTNVSFNPCSRGCFARSFMASPHRSQGCRVSILVLVDVSLEGNDHGNGHQNHDKFQSLFSWMFRSKEPDLKERLVKYVFQSLFSWMFRSKRFEGAR